MENYVSVGINFEKNGSTWILEEKTNARAGEAV